ncbi:MAG TPA: penicillin acylase family protein, partial [Myxococcota bacterium]|nr:penicillin acylase family protein [Myxococcota bacterium]
MMRPTLRPLLRLAQRLTPGRRAVTHTLGGLRDTVEVRTDRWGVPHIHAAHRDDLFFAQGYITARERFFQMDYNRHAAAGRICELVGRRPVPWRDSTVHLEERTTYDVDVFVRAFGLAHAARASHEVHSAEARDIVAAYTAGVNAYVAEGVPSLEHRLLGLPVRLWEPHDAMLMLKAVAFELNFSWRAILLGELLDRAGVPDDVAQALWPQVRQDSATIVSAPEARAALEDLRALRQAASEVLGVGNAAGVGSNCFAVDGAHSATGAAILANDTHMLLSTPSPWFEIGLHGGGLELHGFALAGLPGIGIGRTPHHAWGITAGIVQDLDLFRERLNPNNASEVLTPAGWQKLQLRQERFVVRGEGVTERTIATSRHGPLLETLATGPVAPDERFAVCWTGHAASRELDALLALWQSRTLEACREAAQYHVCPTYNITYAGADGRIAYFLAGTIPKRRADAPLRPLEGWTATWDWQGSVPWVENPQEVAPARGFIVTANNRVVDRAYPHPLGDLFEPPHRFLRIRDRLEALGTEATLDDLAAIQADTQSAWGARTRDVL